MACRPRAVGSCGERTPVRCSARHGGRLLWRACLSSVAGGRLCRVGGAGAGAWCAAKETSDGRRGRALESDMRRGRTRPHKSRQACAQGPAALAARGFETGRCAWGPSGPGVVGAARRVQLRAPRGLPPELPCLIHKGRAGDARLQGAPEAAPERPRRSPHILHCRSHCPRRSARAQALHTERHATLHTRACSRHGRADGPDATPPRRGARRRSGGGRPRAPAPPRHTSRRRHSPLGGWRRGAAVLQPPVPGWAPGHSPHERHHTQTRAHMQRFSPIHTRALLRARAWPPLRVRPHTHDTQGTHTAAHRPGTSPPAENGAR
jgi:hypothetical protein